MANCPRCNMYLAQGAQFCPNCQLNLAQFSYQQPGAHFPPAGDFDESRKEKQYRKILIAICVVMFAELLFSRLPELFDGAFLYTVLKPFRYIITIAWAGLPLFIALVLPKRNQVRVLLIVFASIYAAVSLYYWIFYEFFYYNLWDSEYSY